MLRHALRLIELKLRSQAHSASSSIRSARLSMTYIYIAFKTFYSNFCIYFLSVIICKTSLYLKAQNKTKTTSTIRGTTKNE